MFKNVVHSLISRCRLNPNIHSNKYYSVFGIKNLIYQEQPEKYTVSTVTRDDHDLAVNLMKQYCLKEHVLVRARRMAFTEDRALDKYLTGLLKQGNSLFIKSEAGDVAGICVNYASSPVDPRNLRHYAFYRQDPNTKDFLHFTAKLQETPNLWELFKQPKIFEVRMIAILPEYRRQGLAVMMLEKSKQLAQDQGYHVLRMDCINHYDFKVAERCMLQCLVSFPLHKLRGPHVPFIKKTSEYNKFVRVYVSARIHSDTCDRDIVKQKKNEAELLID